MSGQSNTSRFDVEGHPKTSGGEEYEANTPTVSQNYFFRDGNSARSGRFFNAQDQDKFPTRPHRPTRPWRTWYSTIRNAVGKRINFTYTNEQHYFEIIGVVAKRKRGRPRRPSNPNRVRQLSNKTQPPTSVWRFGTKGDPGALAAAFTRTVRELEPEAPIIGLGTMEQSDCRFPFHDPARLPGLLDRRIRGSGPRARALGLYGVLAYSSPSAPGNSACVSL